MVVYFDVPDVPGRYFACARYGTMSDASCAKNYEAAPQAVRSGRLDGCLGCKIGARHAAGAGGDGVAAEAVVAAAPPQCGAICVRCRRSGRDAGSRLVGRMRLVRGHTICVSCYNREREVVHGANAKGAAPRKWRGLFRARVVYVNGTDVVRNRMPSPVADHLEVALTLLRQSTATGIFYAGSPVIRMQEGS